MPTDRHPKERAGSETRTPVHIDADVYDDIRKLAIADERTIVRYVNKVLRDHIQTRKGRPVKRDAPDASP